MWLIRAFVLPPCHNSRRVAQTNMPDLLSSLAWYLPVDGDAVPLRSRSCDVAPSAIAILTILAVFLEGIYAPCLPVYNHITLQDSDSFTACVRGQHVYLTALNIWIIL